VPQAEATRHARVVTDVAALRLIADASGRVSSVVYAGQDKVEQQVSARIFVLAGGAVENARLLLLSRSREFPIANRSGLMGRYFMSHPSIEVLGRARDNVYPYRIGFSTAMSRRFAVGVDAPALVGLAVVHRLQAFERRLEVGEGLGARPSALGFSPARIA
jgi:choline dehydrogenase-like flavoprotein